MLTFTRDDNNTYIVIANEKFIGRLEKKNGVWCLVYKDFSMGVWCRVCNDDSLGNICVPYEKSLELTESELENDFNTWLNDNEIGYFGELSHAEYEE